MTVNNKSDDVKDELKDNVKEGVLDNDEAASDIMSIVSITKLTPGNCEFYLTKGDFIGCKIDGEEKGRVGLFRMMPITMPDDYISVRDKDKKELGIIETIKIFPKNQLDIMQKELHLRYLTPEISEVVNIKEDYGYTFVKANTNAGYREFSMTDLSNNIIFVTPTSAMLIDTDNNRYLIPDINKLTDKASQIIGIWS